MKSVAVLRDLWRARIAVAAIGVLALLLGLSMVYRIGVGGLQSRQYHVGIASARALVDTPSSQIVDLSASTGSDIGTLAARANLLASLMTSSPIKDEIGRRAGVRPGFLVTPVASTGPAASRGAGGVSGAVVSATDRRASVLKATVPALEAGDIPIIVVDTAAPTPRAAARLADAAIAVLKAHIETVAGAERVPQRRRVVVRELGPARATLERRGPSRMIAAVVVLLVLGLGCAALLGVRRLASGWRSASAAERLAGAGAARDGAAAPTGLGVARPEPAVPPSPAANEPSPAPRRSIRRGRAAVTVPSWIDDGDDVA